MSTRRLDASAVLLALVLCAGARLPKRPISESPWTLPSIAAWDISIHPDGSGLPAGKRYAR